MPRKKKKALIFVPVIMLFVIIAIVIILLYLNTDIFKSNQNLFIQYIGQNIENMDDIYMIATEDEYNAKLKENKFTNETQIKINYTENIGTSSENTNNSINQLKLKIEGQTDLKNGYNYQNINLLNKDDEIMQVEYIKDDETCGIRFTDLFKQYILVENTNLKGLLKKIGYSDEEIINVPDEIVLNRGDDIVRLSDEEKEKIKNKYSDLIGSGLSKENFTKENNQIIKINEKDINVNKYTLKMTKEQLNDIYIKVLEEIVQDEIILNKIDNIQEAIKQYEIVNNLAEINLREKFINQINKKIQEIKEKNIGRDEASIIVYENNKATVRTSIVSSEYTMNFDWLPEENKKYARY